NPRSPRVLASRRSLRYRYRRPPRPSNPRAWESPAMRRVFTVLLFGLATGPALAADALPQVTDVERQPLQAQARRVADALDVIGAPLSGEDLTALRAACDTDDQGKAVQGIQNVLDKYCLT